MKKLLYALIGYISYISNALAQEGPPIGGEGLPGRPIDGSGNNEAFDSFANALISYFIQIVAVVAVLALMLSGILLIISGGEEEKFKKAKTWFTWSLVGVLVSITAWFMINFLNKLSIG